MNRRGECSAEGEVFETENDRKPKDARFTAWAIFET